MSNSRKQQYKIMRITSIKPYENNPRNNEAAVDAVANSIKEFGFRAPIIVDKDGVIIAGHTRYKAAQKIGRKTVPVIVAEDMSPQQVKAYRLADNKTGEFAEWDENELAEELDGITDFNMGDFGFDVPDVTDDLSDDFGYYGDERERTADEYNLHAFNENRTEGFYQMPKITGVDYVPTDLIGFNYVLSAKKFDTGVHFYVDDYQFERIWSRPDFYIEKIEPFECALSPDFSLYMDMPIAMKIWNTYRSRMIGQMMQDAGLIVIPTVSWAEPETFAFCFDGLPENATLSVSTVGVKESAAAKEIWTAGMDEMIKRKKPRKLIVYGGALDYDYGNIEVHYYDNAVTKAWKGE